MQQPKGETIERRMFLKHASMFAIALPSLQLGIFSTGCARNSQGLTTKTAESNSKSASWTTVLVGKDEPGEPLIVSGTIYAPDGRTPLPGMSLFVYQTDATGRYSTSGGDNRNTRIHGVMQTNLEGRYEFRTIKPASYPSSTIVAHIHAYVSGPGYPEYWIDEYWFEGDRFLTSEMRAKVSSQGSFSPILTLQRDSDGVWRGARDIKVERCSRNCTGR